MNTITELFAVACDSQPPDAETLKAAKDFMRRWFSDKDNAQRRFELAYTSLLNAQMAQMSDDNASQQKSLNDLRAALGEQQQPTQGSLRTKSAAGTRVRQAPAADGRGSFGCL